MIRFLTTVIVVLAAAMVIGPAAMAQSQAIPTPIVEEVMVKTSLLTLNDANLTGDYDVMHAKMAKPFRERFSADTLKQAFKTFAGKHIDVIAAQRIVSTSEPTINADGALMLRGYFDTTPSRLSYALDYAVSEGEWKLIRIDVNVRGSSTSDAGSVDLLMHAAADLSGAAP
jgi:hypothetical protein